MVIFAAEIYNTRRDIVSRSASLRSRSHGEGVHTYDITVYSGGRVVYGIVMAAVVVLSE